MKVLHTSNEVSQVKRLTDSGKIENDDPHI